MFFQRRLALTNQFRPLPDAPPDDAHPHNPDQHERGQQEQRPKKVPELRPEERLRRRWLRQGKPGNQPNHPDGARDIEDRTSEPGAARAGRPLHEPGHSSSASFSSSSSTTQPVWTFSRTRTTTRRRTNQFMVPMRVRKQMEALHESPRPHREEALISVRDKSAPPHVGSYQKLR